VTAYVELSRWDVWDCVLWNGSNVILSENTEVIFAQTTYNDSHAQQQRSVHCIYNINAIFIANIKVRCGVVLMMSLARRHTNRKPYLASQMQSLVC